ncbi:MAG: sulfurtransferase TusA family protein [Thermodesulfobacteriota bacterium]
MTDTKHNQSIDITKEICPMTFVKTKLKLETMVRGQVLEVTLREGEPLSNLPKSVEQEGHRVLEIYKEDPFYKILIERC